MDLCLNCKIRNIHRPRGLCKGCYGILEVRSLYPIGGPPAQTVEEVEALVAEQMQHLPEWWERQRALDHDVNHDRRVKAALPRRPGAIRVFARRGRQLVRVRL